MTKIDVPTNSRNPISWVADLRGVKIGPKSVLYALANRAGGTEIPPHTRKMGRWVADLRDVKAGPKSVLFALVSQADENGCVFKSIDWIAAAAGCSKRTADRHLARLEATGLVTREEHSEKGRFIQLQTEEVRP